MARELKFWRVWSFGLNTSVWLALISFLVPIGSVVLMSFQERTYLSFPPRTFSGRWYHEFLGNDDYQTAILNSLLIGVSASVLATIAGACAALALIRTSAPGRRVLSLLVMAPAVLPQIIVAIGLYPIAVWLGLQGTLPAVILAHAVIAMPFPLVTISGALMGYSDRLEIASMTLGANYVQTFRHVTLPIIAPGVIAGFIFAFASLDELVLVNVPQQPNHQNTPVAAVGAAELPSHT